MIRSRARARGGYKSIYWAVRKAFATGRDGFLYDYSNINTLNQLSTGTTPVTAVTNPVGFTADARLGLALGAELVTNGTFDTDTAWTKGAGWGILGGVASITISADVNAIYQSLVSAGKYYAITFTITAVSAQGFRALCGGTVGTARTAVGTYTETLQCGVANAFAGVICNAAGTTGSIDNISIKLLEGNHAIQATAGARPTWEVDAQGFYYLSFLGTDDSLTSATGGAGSNGIFWCAVVQPTGGAGTVRVLWDDRGANTGYVIYLSNANKLVFQAGNGAAYTTLTSTATVDVGTKYLLTILDDGSNLSIQINAGAAETVGRPVVAAGSAGFTIGKTNGAATFFLIGNLYPNVYFRDTHGTAAEREAAQAWARAKGGM